MHLVETEASALERVIANALADPEFKARLRTNPRAILNDAGISIPDGIEIIVVEDTAYEKHIVIPDSPSRMPLADEDVIERVITDGVHGAKGSRATIMWCTECCKTKKTSNYCCT